MTRFFRKVSTANAVRQLLELREDNAFAARKHDVRVWQAARESQHDMADALGQVLCYFYRNRDAVADGRMVEAELTNRLLVAPEQQFATSSAQQQQQQQPSLRYDRSSSGSGGAGPSSTSQKKAKHAAALAAARCCGLAPSSCRAPAGNAKVLCYFYRNRDAVTDGRVVEAELTNRLLVAPEQQLATSSAQQQQQQQPSLRYDRSSSGSGGAGPSSTSTLARQAL
eukprot:jgi/Sobl393_1/19475/SZX69072.1